MTNTVKVFDNGEWVEVSAEEWYGEAVEDDDYDYEELRDMYGLHDGLFFDDNPNSPTCGQYI